MVPILITKNVFESGYNEFEIHSLKPQLVLHQAN